LEVIYPKFLKVRECRKAMQGASAEPVGGKSTTGTKPQVDPESLDEWK
jgi:hypothetical protein